MYFARTEWSGTLDLPSLANHAKSRGICLPLQSAAQVRELRCVGLMPLCSPLLGILWGSQPYLFYERFAHLMWFPAHVSYLSVGHGFYEY